MDKIPENRAEGFEGQVIYRLPRAVVSRIRRHTFIRDFVVTDLGHLPAPAGHYVRRERGVDQWILIFAAEGRGWVRWGGGNYQVGQGEVALIPPGHAHSYGAQASDPWSIYWFHFDGAGAESLLQWSEPRRGVLACSAPEAVKRQFRSILLATAGGYREHYLLELSRVLINVLTLLHRDPLKARRNRAYERIERVMTVMKERLGEPPELAELARLAGLSVSQFSHLFKLHAGCSPMSYFNQLRMQRACELLDNTGLSVKEIAARVGYADPLHFSRSFRRCFGSAPSQYRDGASR